MTPVQKIAGLAVLVLLLMASAAGVVHAARRAQLDPAHAQRIIAITGDGDNAVIALRACQAYVRAVLR